MPFRFDFGSLEDDNEGDKGIVADSSNSRKEEQFEEIPDAKISKGLAQESHDSKKTLPHLDPNSIHHLLALFIRADSSRTGVVSLTLVEKLAGLSGVMAKGLGQWTRERRKSRWGFMSFGQDKIRSSTLKGSNTEMIDPSTWISALSHAHGLPYPSQGPTGPNPLSIKNQSNSPSKLPTYTPRSRIVADFLKEVEESNMLPPLEDRGTGVRPKTTCTLALAIAHGSQPMFDYVRKEYSPALGKVLVPVVRDSDAKSGPVAVTLKEFIFACDNPMHRVPLNSPNQNQDLEYEGGTPTFKLTSSSITTTLATIYDSLYPQPPSSRRPYNPPSGWLPEPRPESRDSLVFPGEIYRDVWEGVGGEGEQKVLERLRGKGEEDIVKVIQWMHTQATRETRCHPSKLTTVLDSVAPEPRIKALRCISEEHNFFLAPAGSRPYCCECGRVVGVTVCQNCGVTGFCGEVHFKSGMQWHKRWCKALQRAASRIPAGRIMGTKGWEGKNWKAIQSWKDFFRGQDSKAKDAPTRAEIEDTELASFPLTLALALHRLAPFLSSQGIPGIPADPGTLKFPEASSNSPGVSGKSHRAKLCVHVIGAAGKEERVAWGVLAWLLPNWIAELHLLFVGPESEPSRISSARGFPDTDGGKSQANLPKITTQSFTGCYHNLGAGLRRGHVCVMFNPGIHHYESWERSLVCILRSPLCAPLLVTTWGLTEAIISRSEYKSLSFCAASVLFSLVSQLARALSLSVYLSLSLSSFYSCFPSLFSSFPL
ncbi:hypothetical protein AAMO2058_000853200 [Amorphochlora amoebiformis]